MRKSQSSKALLWSGTALAGVTGALLLTAMISRPAQAVPSYGYAEIGFTNFALTGIVNGQGGLQPGVSNLTDTVLVQDASNYPGALPGGGSAFGDLTTGANVTQATSGPGPFPVEDTFTPALGSSSGTRGDGAISGAIASGATSNMVAEGNLTLGPASAGSSAGSTTTITANFDTTAALTVGLSFNASTLLKASVGQIGDTATANVSATFSIFDNTTGQYISICDKVNGGCTIAGTNLALAEVAPNALNANVGTNLPSSPRTVSSGPTFYSYTAALAASNSYTVNLGDGASDLLKTVPEPVSIAVLGTALVGLGAVRRRRRQ